MKQTKEEKIEELVVALKITGMHPSSIEIMRDGITLALQEAIQAERKRILEGLEEMYPVSVCSRHKGVVEVCPICYPLWIANQCLDQVKELINKQQ